MGAQRFQEVGTGADLATAFSAAQKEAEEEYGHREGYSGQINMACGVKDITQEYKNSKKDMDTFIDDKLHELSKHNPCMAICTSTPKANNNQIKTQVEHNVVHGTKKWITYHCVYAGWKKDTFIGRALTKGAAVKIARAHTSKTKEETYVILKKGLSDPKMAEEATITYKKASDERNGIWVLFGIASY